MTGRITQIQLVVIPSSDQARSTEFYESIGFEKRADQPFGDGYRWIEFYPPGGTAGIALVPPRRGAAAGIETGMILNTDDIDAAHARLRSAGVDVDAEIAREGAPGEIRIGGVSLVGPKPAMFYLRDPDANTLLVVAAG